MELVAAHVIAALLLSSLQAAAPISPADQLAELHRVGALAYVDNLYRNERSFGQVLQGVETGDAEWLRLAQDMKPAADGAVAEQLQTALAKALVVRPGNVLAVLSRGGDVTRWAVDFICGAPIPAPGKAWLTRYRQRALTVVSLVREPQLKKVRQDCLGALERIDLSMPDGFYE